MVTVHVLSSVLNKDKADINYRGIVQIDNEKYITFCTDPFCSIPLYFYQNDTSIWIFSDIDQFKKNNNFNRIIDTVGFWEIIIFGTSLWTRTLYEKIKQVPSASKLTINKETGSVQIKRYWDFYVEENPSLQSSKKASESVHEQLTSLLGKINTESNYCMGLSGGLDSRLSLAYFSKNLKKDQIKLFTYGFSKKLLEYTYAKNVASVLGFNEPEFYSLHPQIYRNALIYLPDMSAGQISIEHCHILSYLKEKKNEDFIQISNYYSDGVFGYSARFPKDTRNESNSYLKKISDIDFLNSDIKNAIYNDVYLLCEDYKQQSNFSSINEYLYITERNPKFHMRLAYLQNRIVRTKTPYADLDLLKLMLSIPIRFRERKIILDNIFKSFFPQLQGVTIGEQSSRIHPRFMSAKEWWTFRLYNLINGFLRVSTNGRLQIFNKYQTEEHERLLFTEFKKDLFNATSTLVKRKLLNKKQQRIYNKLPFRAKSTGSKFSMISIVKELIDL